MELDQVLAVSRGGSGMWAPDADVPPSPGERNGSGECVRWSYKPRRQAERPVPGVRLFFENSTACHNSMPIVSRVVLGVSGLSFGGLGVSGVVLGVVLVLVVRPAFCQWGLGVFYQP